MSRPPMVMVIGVPVAWGIGLSSLVGAALLGDVGPVLGVALLIERAGSVLTPGRSGSLGEQPNSTAARIAAQGTRRRVVTP
jgi:hypothetical protein